jgi:hypothetical protein
MLMVVVDFIEQPRLVSKPFGIATFAGTPNHSLQSDPEPVDGPLSSAIMRMRGKNEMINFSYIGRPDGLGNRIEEIIKLELICSQTYAKCEYIWNNKYSTRSYDICFQSENVNIVVQREPLYPVKQLSDFKACFSQEEILTSAKKIIPNFSIYFEENIRPVGVHIRASDRIGQNHRHFMKDEKELQGYLSETIDVLNKNKPKYVYVCSESKRCRNVFLRYLNKDIEIVEPTYDKQIPPEYVDLFALTLCSEIWMVSRFSSFSITASLIGNIPLVTFIDDKEVRERYLAIFRYQLSHGREIVKESLLDRNILRQIKKTIVRITRRCT